MFEASLQSLVVLLDQTGVIKTSEWKAMNATVYEIVNRENA